MAAAAAAAAALFAGVSRRGSPTPRHRRRGRPGSSSSWRARASEEGRASSSELRGASGMPVVAILWDLDNVSPGVDPERARITARRLRDAASRLGGGALGGASAANGEDKAGPAEVVAFLGFANDATLEKVSARALREEGVDVRRARSTPDAADMDLGAHVCGFARAWEAQVNAGVANIPPPTPYEQLVTPRALAAARDAAVCGADAEDAAALASDAGAALALAAAETERAAFEHFAKIFEHFASSVRLTNAEPPSSEAALLMVTSDNDLVPAVSFARRSGCHVVACGDFLPKTKTEGGKAQASKRQRAKRRRFSSGVSGSSKRTNKNLEVGVTPSYWSFLQDAANRRPVGRLKLAAASDAALVWDSTRAFDVEKVDGISARDDSKKNSTRDTAIGGIVGVWRSRGAQRGVGRWPSPRPAIPREDEP